MPALLLDHYTIFYYLEVRFSALAANPNQFAFLVVGMPFLAASWLPRLRSGIGWSIMLAVLVLSCIAGLASLSNALVGAWVLGICCIGLFVLRDWRDQPTGIFAFLWVVGLAFALQSAGGMATVVHYLSPMFTPEVKSDDSILASARDFFEQLPSTPGEEWKIEGTEPGLHLSADVAQRIFQASELEQQQLSARTNLWRHGLEAIKHAPILGNGPGHFSGLNGPFEGREAHNTLIDWTASTGVVGLMVLLTWAGYLAWWLWRRKNLMGLAGFVALVFLAQFHFVMRQPVVWFVLVTFAALPANDVRCTVDGQET